MASLLVKVRKKMSIYAHQKVRGVLEGEYGSVFKGRSIDFDDLRAYVPGDDVKDIDWKATARGGQILIKRYIAIRKHNILLVVNTGRNMAALAPSGETKRDIAVMTAGVIAYIAQKHGDLIALVAGDQDNVAYMPLKSDTPHLERMLQYIDTRTTLRAGASSIEHVLDYIARNIRRKMMVVIISDGTGLNQEEQRILRRLTAQHEVLFVAIDDLDPTDPKWRDARVQDVEATHALPSLVRRNKRLATNYSETLKQQWLETTRTLEHLKINSIRIASEKDVVADIVRLLEKQKHARR